MSKLLINVVKIIESQEIYKDDWNKEFETDKSTYDMLKDEVKRLIEEDTAIEHEDEMTIFEN